MKRWMVMGLVTLNRVASADTYPVAVVDRPLLLLPGMTTLDSAINFPTYVNTTIDASGNKMTTTTSLTKNDVPEFTVTHRFGPVQVTADFTAEDLAGVVVFETGLPGVMSLSYGWQIPNVNNDDYADTQDLNYSNKRILVPHRFSIGYRAGLSLGEYGGTSNVTGLPDSGHETRFGSGVGSTFQATPHVSLGIGIGGSVPLEASKALQARESAYANTSIVLAIHRLDVYAAFELDGLTRIVHPYLGMGCSVRLGQPD